MHNPFGDGSELGGVLADFCKDFAERRLPSIVECARAFIGTLERRADACVTEMKRRILNDRLIVGCRKACVFVGNVV